MPPPKFLIDLLAPYFAHPSGIRGRIVAALMNRGNRRMNEHTIDALALKASDRVVDVGFGGGLTLEPLAERAREVIAIDPSPAMVERARSQHKKLVAANKLRLESGVMEKLPLESSSVDALMTVNTIYFWTDPAKAISEIARVLKPGGRVALTFLPGDRMDRMPAMFPPAIFARRDPADVEKWLHDAGLAEVRTYQESERARGGWCSVTARR